ncbi:HNH endonuclease family protein [Candidatus Poriferisodalis sp.]|uniref:HNH endonuclease family protein n=1 Tax=Candidatus Poriferisodalis sp. TaxID=3101277 RepID=UPI003B521CE7
MRDTDAEAADLERRRSVIGLFERLRIEVEHRSGYSRDAVFPGWLYSNGQTTRERVLAQEQHPDGTWNSAYDNTTVTSAGDLDIDHLVPLAEAWESGGYVWSADTWTRFANDLGDSRSLIAVSSSTNRSKGARDPHDWWPPQATYRCQYAADWIAVKTRWELSADTAEERSLDTQLSSCTGAEFEFAVPAKGSVTIEESSLEDASSPETPGETSEADTDSADTEAAAPGTGCHPAYEPCLPNLPGDAVNCGDLTSEQKPVRVKVIGEDPYRLDRDGNGVGCQS